MSITRKRLLVYLVMILSLTALVKLTKDIVRIKGTDQRLSAAQAELAALKNEQAELRQALLTADQGGWWEKQVRDILKMARTDEVVVVVPEAVTKVKPMSTPASQAVDREGESISNWQKWRIALNF